MSGSLSTSDQQVYKKVMRAKNMSMTQAQLEQSMPGMQRKDIISSIGSLVQKRLFSITKGKDELLLYSAVPVDEVKKKTTLTQEQKVVLDVIGRYGDRGVATQAIHREIGSDIIHLSLLRRSLQVLEKENHIKTFKSINAPLKPLYILSNLKPAENLAGGIWFDDSKEYDDQMVSFLCKALYIKVQQMTFPSIKTRDKSQTALCANPINPPSKTAQLPTPHFLLRYIKDKGITQSQLSVKNIMELMRALELDGKVEVIKPVGGVEVPDEDGESSENDAGPSKRRKVVDDDGDEDEDEEEKENRLRRQREKEKERLKEKKRREKEREREKAKAKEKKEREKKKKERARRKKEKEKERKKRKEREKEKERKKKKKKKYESSDEDSDQDSDDALVDINETDLVDGKSSKKSKSSKSKSKSKSKSSSSKSKSSKRKRVVSSEDGASSDAESTAESSSGSGSDPDSDSDSDSETAESSSDSDSGSSVSSVDSDDLDNQKQRVKPISSAINNQISNSFAFSGGAASGIFDLSDTAVVYRATRRVKLSLGQTQAPCGKCPQFVICEDDGPVNPMGCEYYEGWLGNSLGGWDADALSRLMPPPPPPVDVQETILGDENGNGMEVDPQVDQLEEYK